MTMTQQEMRIEQREGGRQLCRSRLGASPERHVHCKRRPFRDCSCRACLDASCSLDIPVESSKRNQCDRAGSAYIVALRDSLQTGKRGTGVGANVGRRDGRDGILKLENRILDNAGLIGHLGGSTRTNQTIEEVELGLHRAIAFQLSQSVGTIGSAMGIESEGEV